MWGYICTVAKKGVFSMQQRYRSTTEFTNNVAFILKPEIIQDLIDNCIYLNVNCSVNAQCKNYGI